MTTQEIANRLVAYCRKADWESDHKALYAPNVPEVLNRTPLRNLKKSRKE